MTTELDSFGSAFWLRWVLASAGGFVFGFVASFALNFLVLFPIMLERIFDDIFLAIFGAVIWAVVGLAQRFVLRRSLIRIDYWVLTSSLGGAAGLAAYAAIGPQVSIAASIVIEGVTVGAAVGIAQWLVLRRRVSRAGWWILVNSLAGSTLFIVFGVGESFVNFVMALVVAALSYGAVTGATLVWLLRNNPQNWHDDENYPDQP